MSGFQDALSQCFEYVYDYEQLGLYPSKVGQQTLELSVELPQHLRDLYNSQEGQLTFRIHLFEDETAPRLSVIAHDAEGNKLEASLSQAQLMTKSTLHHLKPLLHILTNDLEILWIAHRHGELAASAKTAAASAASAASAGAAAGTPALQHMVDCVLHRLSHRHESYNHAVLGQTGNASTIDKTEAAVQILSYVLEVVSQPRGRLCYRRNVLCRIVQLIHHEVHHLCQRCFICGTQLAAPADHPSTCSNDLCRYKVAQSGLFIELLPAVQRRTDVVTLLLHLACAAVGNPQNRADMLNPGPADFIASSVGGDSPRSNKVLWEQLATGLDAVPPVEEMGVCDTEAQLQQLLLEKGAALEDPFFHPAGGNKLYNLLWWVISNIHDDIQPISKEQMKQYLTGSGTSRGMCSGSLAAVPDANAICFTIHAKASTATLHHKQLVAAKRATAAFHGSKLCNWYSIVKHGLRNVSNTRMMTSGAAYGAGIYLSRQHGTSLGYCGPVYCVRSRSSAAYATVNAGAQQGQAAGDTGDDHQKVLAAGPDGQQEKSEEDEKQQLLRLKREQFASTLGFKSSQGISYVLGVCDVVRDERVRGSGSILVAPEAELVSVTHLIVALR